MKTRLLLIILNCSFYILNSFAQSGWEIIPTGINTDLNSIYFYDHEVGYAVGDSGIVLKSINSGKTWQAVQTPVVVNLNDIYLFHRDTIDIVGDDGTMLFSTDGGSYWWVSSFLTEDYYCVFFSGGSGICGGSSQTILWGTYTSTILYWNEIQSGFFGGGFWGATMLSPQIGFVAGENSIFQPLLGKTIDGGVTWDFTSFYLNNNEGKATGVDFTDINIGYISASVWDGTGAISKTTDSGNNWITTMFSNPLWSIDFPISGASQVGYAVGDNGTILKTFDAGYSWQSQISGSNVRLNGVYFLDLDYGFAVGENGTLLRTTTGGEPVTRIEDENQSLFSFQLYQNYPNPFNPSTKIRFVIPNEVRNLNDFSSQTPRNDNSLVRLKVYDVLGNELATLINEELTAGEYEVEFSPEASINNPASGIYFYQLRAGSFIQTKKMILLQ